jgi:hypothetical protein
MSTITPPRRVVLARAVAARYITEGAVPEYRLSVFLDGENNRNVPGLVNGFRDGRVKLGGLTAPSDFGAREEFDAMTMWTADGLLLGKIASWFESRGFETTGVH